LLRDNASRISIGLIAVAMLLSTGACLGDSESPDMGLAISPVYRSPTSTPSPIPAVIQQMTTPRPCPSEYGGLGPWVELKDVTICLPTSFTVSVVERIDGPSEDIAYIIERGSSEVRIDAHTEEIVEWNVAPGDEEEFRRLILEPLEKAGD
jgi:hypothetical protein